MAIHQGSVAPRQHRNLEFEFADAIAHAIHGRVVLPRISGVEDQSVNGPVFDALREWIATS
jgi:hypothetical protein